jgi:hypothetical protein
MANTYTLIQAQTLASSAASVTFSSIPATYTDLVLRHSSRATTSNVQLYMKVNGATTGLSVTLLGGDGGTAFSYNSPSGYPGEWLGFKDRSTDTANTFGSGEVYIPSYTVSQNKPFSTVSVTENNASDAFIGLGAKLWSNTTAITSLEIYGQSGDLATHSSFYLYGIKNS